MKKAFTTIELLVSITIVAALIALLLPAFQSVRESARRLNCSSNLKQISLGCLQYEQTHGHMPCGGWAYGWTGDPDMGFGENQPGGWIYNILPFIEETGIRNIGAGQTFESKKVSLQEAARTPISLFSCSSRRPAKLYDFNPVQQMFNMNNIPAVARGDYAINAGSQTDCEIYYGPSTIAQGLNRNYQWPDVSDHTGVSYQRSKIKIAHITDGSSKTYLLGEKYMNPLKYTNGKCVADNNHLLTGYENDNSRTTFNPPVQDESGKDYKAPSRSNASLPNRFGSAHSNSLYMSMCDGSVRSIEYNIEASLHRSLGNRKDGQVSNLAGH